LQRSQRVTAATIKPKIISIFPAHLPKTFQMIRFSSSQCHISFLLMLTERILKIWQDDAISKPVVTNCGFVVILWMPCFPKHRAMEV